MRTIHTAIILAALCVAATGCRKAPEARSPEKLPVEVANPVVDSVTLYKDYPGTLSANRTVGVVCRVNGTVSGPLYTAGDFVRKGQVLYTVESSTIRDEVRQAEASLASARSENEYAEEHYLAVSRALESNAVSKMEVAQALSARDQSRAAVRTAEAALSTARTRLGYCTITAPVSGHATINNYSGGSYIAGEGEPVTLATVYEDAQVIAEFAIEDASFQRMFLNPNNRHLIDYKAIPLKFSEKLPHDYTANLDYMAPNVDASTGTMIVQGVVENPYNELKAGMYVTIHMPYKVEPKALLVRSASIGTDQLGQYMYVVNDSDRVVYTPVKAADVVADTMRVVTSGIRPGDRYVTEALLKVRDGMEVSPYGAKNRK